MKIKLLFLIILLHISLFTLTAQIKPDFIRFDLPSFVPAEKHFNTSIVFKLKELKEGSIEIKFQKFEALEIESAKLRTIDEYIDLDFTSIENIITIPLSKIQFSFVKNTPYQIILDCYSTKSVKLEKNNFNLVEEIIEQNEEELFNSISKKEIEEIDFCETQKAAGKSLQLNENSNLEFQLREISIVNLFTEFWIKPNGQLESSISISKLNTNESVISISQNDFGFVSFPIYENELVRNDVYLSPGSWNYIGILLSNTSQGIKGDIYINEVLAFSTLFENIMNLENLKVSFSNVLTEDKYEIDRLKIWNFENNIELAKLNKHFLAYEADSSIIIYQTNFESLDEFVNDENSGEVSIISENITYNNSEAPIFSKAPQLTVAVGSNYNSIEWFVQEHSVAKEFVLERAIGEDKFIEIFNTIAESDPLRIYNYTDEVFPESDIAYYRVKQINEDGTEVYSPEIKIGHKEIHEFNLGQNYPNPFNPITNLYVEVLVSTDFEINVYDLVGNNVKRIYDGILPEGLHTFEFDGSNLPSGIYFYEVISPYSQVVKKMILAK